MSTPPQPKPGAPQPDLSDFTAPIEPDRRRTKAISIIAGVLVLAMIGGFVAFAVFSGDDEPSPGYSTDGVSGDLAQAAGSYVEATNAGDVTAFRASLCSSEQSRFTDAQDRPASTNPMRVVGVSEVQVDGDHATADVAIAPVNSPDTTAQTERLAFQNEGGWRFCGLA